MSMTKEELCQLALDFIEEAWLVGRFTEWLTEAGYSEEEVEEAWKQES